MVSRWAHNSKVGGSKPLSAIFYTLILLAMKSKWWERSPAGWAFHLHVDPVGQTVPVEIMVAWCPHHCLLRNHGTLEFRDVDGFLVFKDADETYGAL